MAAAGLPDEPAVAKASSFLNGKDLMVKWYPPSALDQLAPARRHTSPLQFRCGSAAGLQGTGAAFRQPYLQLDADGVGVALQSRDPAVQVTGLEAGHDGL